MVYSDHNITPFIRFDPDYAPDNERPLPPPPKDSPAVFWVKLAAICTLVAISAAALTSAWLR